MEDHIIEKHSVQDKENYFNCGDCTFKTINKEEFGRHFKDNHSIRTQKHDSNNHETIEVVDEDGEELSIKTELKLLRSNFERLEHMYHEALDEVNKVRSEYEIKIITAHDNFRTVKAENEVLKEKVDVLFKLGRSYINNSKKQEASNENMKGTNINEEGENASTTEADDLENLHTWTQNKMRGFRRVDPTKPPNKPKPTINPSTKPPTNPPKPAATEETTTPRSRTPTGTQAPPMNEDIGPNPYRGKYCHYFVNQGKCRFEERTGEQCKFEHKQAPMCNFGTSCNRLKCMKMMKQ